MAHSHCVHEGWELIFRAFHPTEACPRDSDPMTGDRDVRGPSLYKNIGGSSNEGAVGNETSVLCHEAPAGRYFLKGSPSVAFCQPLAQGVTAEMVALTEAPSAIFKPVPMSPSGKCKIQ